jgi:hypothetical protein
MNGGNAAHGGERNPFTAPPAHSRTSTPGEEEEEVEKDDSDSDEDMGFQDCDDMEEEEEDGDDAIDGASPPSPRASVGGKAPKAFNIGGGGKHKHRPPAKGPGSRGGKGGKAPAWVLLMQKKMEDDEKEARRLEKEEYERRKKDEHEYDKQMIEKYGPTAGCNPS